MQLYIAKSSDGETIKIGRTQRNPNDRLAEISREHRKRFRLVASFPIRNSKTETEIHNMLNVFREDPCQREYYVNDGDLEDLIWHLERYTAPSKQLTIMAMFFYGGMTGAGIRDILEDSGFSHSYCRETFQSAIHFVLKSAI